MHGECIVEFGGASVVEAASALVVEYVGGVLGFGWGDGAEVGAAGEPPAGLAVVVLGLAALPGLVGVAEPHVEAVVGGGGGPVRPFRPAVEGGRAAQVRGYLVEALDQPGEGGLGGVAVGHGDRDAVAGLALDEPDHRGAVAGADDPVCLPVAGLGAAVRRGGPLGDAGPVGPRPGGSRPAAVPAAPPGPQALVGPEAERPAVEGLVDGLGAGPARDLLGFEVRADRRRRAASAQVGDDAARYASRPPPRRTSRATVVGCRPTRRAIDAQLADGSSISARLISSRSCNSTAAPGMLVPPSVTDRWNSPTEDIVLRY